VHWQHWQWRIIACALANTLFSNIIHTCDVQVHLSGQPDEDETLELSAFAWELRPKNVTKYERVVLWETC
jgi:hypothetical protein